MSLPGDNLATCWTVICGAAAGDAGDRDEFAHHYLPLVRSCFATRWHGSALGQQTDDAVQEVFLECLREGGLLAKVASEPPRSFHAFLFGAIKNVALRVERRDARRDARLPRAAVEPDAVPAADDSLSRLFDRLWALALVRRAIELHRRRAERAADPEALRRVEVLRLRFEEDLPIRAVAARWGVPAEAVHALYRKARSEYRNCLREMVAFHHPGAPESVETEYDRLLALIG